MVEDNEDVRKIVFEILNKHGYEVLIANNGVEALEILSSHGEAVHLLLTDVIMPEMNGKELYTELSRINPKLKVLYMSGYTNNVIVHHGVLDEGVQFIQKPFTTEGLAVKVREVLNQ